MLLKIMFGDGRPDEDPFAQYKLLSDVQSVDFIAGQGKAPGFDRSPSLARVVFRGESHYEEFNVEGNAYVMSDAGKTVSSFCGQLPPDQN